MLYCLLLDRLNRSRPILFRNWLRVYNSADEAPSYTVAGCYYWAPNFTVDSAPVPVAGGSRECRRELWEQAYHDGMYCHKKCFWFVPWQFLISVKFFKHHFAVNTTAIPITSTGFKLVSVRRHICSEGKTQTLEPHESSKICCVPYLSVIASLSLSFVFFVLCCMQN